MAYGRSLASGGLTRASSGCHLPPVAAAKAAR
jgi:hypothetical protein